MIAKGDEATIRTACKHAIVGKNKFVHEATARERIVKNAIVAIVAMEAIEVIAGLKITSRWISLPEL